jgi:pyruvate dehydrogenase E2 component (dihydrolipoamide acetyltransferase)
MKTYEFKLPDIGEGVTEGEIVKWLVSPGNVVTEDQPIVEVMTDKATVTITAPKAGKILETRGAEGGIVLVHSVLVVFGLDGGPESSPITSTSSLITPESSPITPESSPITPESSPITRTEGPAATAVGDIKETLPGMDLGSFAPVAAANSGALSYFNDKPLATPATRKLARELGVDLRAVEPTGPNGRVTSTDVRMHGAAPAASAASAPNASSSPAAASSAAPAPRAPAPPVAAAAPAYVPVRITTEGKGTEGALEERIPLRGVRKRIFDGMARSKHTAAHFTFVEECDVTALKALRARLRPAAERASVKLTFLPFFVKAVVAALKKHPMLNSAFDESTQEIVKRRAYHIGIASATEAGLIVPVVRDADRKSLLDIARDIARLAEDTKSGRVRPEDLGGSTFTITSLGQQGGLFATPILNFPEVAILGIHQMKEKPVVRDGQIVIGDVMLLSLSFDHRIIDGHIGAAFAYEIIAYLQDPDRLFLEMG